MLSFVSGENSRNSPPDIALNRNYDSSRILRKEINSAKQNPRALPK